jgi:hypothetical protein
MITLNRYTAFNKYFINALLNLIAKKPNFNAPFNTVELC